MPYNTLSDRYTTACHEHVSNLFHTTQHAGNQAFSEAGHVTEDKAFYVPDVLSDAKGAGDLKCHAAAADYARHLGEAERLLGDALNLVALMLVSLGDESDSRALQLETALKVIEDKLASAHDRIDKHDHRHTNLFLAYFDLKDKAGGRGQD